jgi:hypothetical protein
MLDRDIAEDIAPWLVKKGADSLSLGDDPLPSYTAQPPKNSGIWRHNPGCQLSK